MMARIFIISLVLIFSFKAHAQTISLSCSPPSTVVCASGTGPTAPGTVVSTCTVSGYSPGTPLSTCWSMTGDTTDFALAGPAVGSVQVVVGASGVTTTCSGEVGVSVFSVQPCASSNYLLVAPGVKLLANTGVPLLSK